MSDDVANEKAFTAQGDNTLSRQITMSLSPDQYERLFFQPTASKGDLAKRLGTTPRQVDKVDQLTTHAR